MGILLIVITICRTHSVVEGKAYFIVTMSHMIVIINMKRPTYGQLEEFTVTQ